MHSAERKLQINKPSTSKFNFDTVADSYDNWYDSRQGIIYDRLEKKLIASLLPTETKGKKLLEIGCGTGHWSQFFSGFGFHITGVDVSERMIKIAQSRNVPNASFQIADAHSLPFNDNSFDITVAITTLEFVHNAELVLQEMARCTHKPSGQLLIGVLNALARLNRNRQENPESLYAKALLFSPEQLKKLLSKYGRTKVYTTGFIPGQKYFLPLSPLVDAVGRLFHLPYGVFIAGQVKL